VPAIVHLPGQTSPLPSPGIFTHVTDDMETFLDVAGVTPPSQAAPALVNALTGGLQQPLCVSGDGQVVACATEWKNDGASAHRPIRRRRLGPRVSAQRGRALEGTVDGAAARARGRPLAVPGPHEGPRRNHGGVDAESLGDPEPRQPVERLYEQRGRRRAVASARFLLRDGRRVRRARMPHRVLAGRRMSHGDATRPRARAAGDACCFQARISTSGAELLQAVRSIRGAGSAPRRRDDAVQQGFESHFRRLHP